MNKKIFLLGLIFIFCLLAFQRPNVYADVKVVEVEESYTIDKNLDKNMNEVTEKLHELTMRKATEAAGFYIESRSEMEGLKLTEDKIRFISGHIIEDGIEENFHYEAADNGKSMKLVCKIKAKVDTSEINWKKILEKIFDNEDSVKVINEKNKIVQEILEENQRIKSQYENAKTETQKTQIKNEFDENQKRFLIAKYERDIDVYDFDSRINLSNISDTAHKLAELDPKNSAAFRATVYDYREQGDLNLVIDVCKKVVAEKNSSEMFIEACTQLGDIYLNEQNNKSEAKKFVDLGIKEVKKIHSKSEIEKLVNGTNVEYNDKKFVGKSNTIRELYILKSDIEEYLPDFESRTVVEDLKILEDRVYNIKYKTDW